MRGGGGRARWEGEEGEQDGRGRRESKMGGGGGRARCMVVLLDLYSNMLLQDVDLKCAHMLVHYPPSDYHERETCCSLEGNSRVQELGTQPYDFM